MVQVPSLPPITAYVHVNYKLWINGGNVTMGPRPAFALSNLTWDDHCCVDHYQPGILGADIITIPQMDYENVAE